MSVRTNSFVQLATGLNRLTTNGWVESRPEVVETPNGIVARGAQHGALFSDNLNSPGSIQIKMSDGQSFKGNPLCLGYRDSSTGTNVYFAKLHDSFAQIVGTNRVVYPDAFDGVNASVSYTYTRAGISQDIRFHARPPSPESLGLNPATTHLLAFTEVTESPVPQIQERTWQAGMETMHDETIGFGTMRMIPGRAFRAANAGKLAGAPVVKKWETIDGRTFVVEQLQWSRIKADLLQLPVVQTNSVRAATNASIIKNDRWYAQQGLPSLPKASGPARQPSRQMAWVSSPSDFVLDWEMVVDTGGIFFFTCDTTWLVDGPTYTTAAAFWPNAVVKYSPGSYLEIGEGAYWSDDESCGSGLAILTEVNDDSVGEHIPYGGSPHQGDYGPAIMLDDCSYISIRDNLDIRYASAGVVCPGVSTVIVTTTDPAAIKGSSPQNNATFTITRIDGNWSAGLPVLVSYGGTAVSGTGNNGDYDVTGSTTITANQASTLITIHPHTPTGDVFAKSVTLTIQASSAYAVGSPSVASVFVEDPSAPAPFPISAPSGLVSWWRGENDATDSKSLNNGALLNGLGFISAFVGQGFNFDGVDDRLTVNDASSLNFNNNVDFSIEAWIKPIAAFTDYGVQSIVDKRNTPNDVSATGYSLHLVNGQLGCQISPAGHVYNFGPTGPDLRDGYYHHVAVTVDRDSTTGGHLYVDGVSILTFNAALAQGDLSNTEPFRIGNHASSWLNAYFKGVIDEVALYNRALSGSEIQSIYTAGRGGKCGGPIIATQPQSQTVVGGANATLTVGVSSSACPPLTYEWFLNGSLVVGATSSALSLTAVHLADAGQYTAIVANNVASASSSAATLTVQEVATPVFSPVGASYPSAQDVTITCATAGATIHYTTDGNDPTESSPTIASGSTVHVDQPLETLKAKAWKTGWTPSDIESEGYRINTAGQSPTVTISPPTGTSILASDDLQVLVEASDLEGSITKIQLFRDGVKVAEAAQGTLTYTMSEAFAGTYVFTAKAFSDTGLVGLAGPVTLTVAASGPVVSLFGAQPYFSSSPATLLASVVGVNPGTLTTLTLNGNPMPLRTGHFQLTPNLTSQGANTFTLIATDNQSRSGQAATTVYFDSAAPTLSITAPLNGASFNAARINVSGTFTESNLKQITVNGVPAFINGGTFTALNVPLVGDVIAISSGEDHCLALRADGTVVGWGANNAGQATPPSGLNGVVGISAGYQYSLAVKADGTVVGWGANGQGQATPPVGLSGVIAVAAGTGQSLALKADGTVTSWGDCSLFGDCPPNGLGGVRAVAANSMYSLVLKNDGTVGAWGVDNFGQTDVAGLSGVVAISAGGGYNFALKSDGTVSRWGHGEYPVVLDPPSGLSGVIAVSGGLSLNSQSLALKSDGTVVGWGGITGGQASPPAGLVGVTAVSASDVCRLALKSDGTIVGWGGNDYGQLTLPSVLKQSVVTVTVQDLAGNITTASVTVNRSPDAAGNLIDPVQLSASTVAGFAPLTVTFTPQATLPGTIVSGGVQYDFDGDGVIDQTANDLTPIQHIYASAGQYFPVVTIQTTAGKFSSVGGWNAPDGGRLRVNVQAAPQQVGSAISVTDPIDLKATADGKLYILSRSAATIYEYDVSTATPTLIRSLSGIGTTPSGLDVDANGNVYVALSGNNQVAKFNPTSGSFDLDTSFNSTGKIGKSDGNPGTSNGEFNAPYDVAITADGEEIVVSDSGNNRIQRFDSDGSFLDSFGEQGNGNGQFNAPKGVAYDSLGYLYVVDGGNNRCSVLLLSDAIGVSGAAGSGLGQFQGAVNLAIGSRGLYVAEVGNNRVQQFEPSRTGVKTPFIPKGALSAGLSLSQPSAVAASENYLEERVYVADTGNNRVILVKLPLDTPEIAWTAMKQSLIAGNIDGAIRYFSAASAPRYREAYLSAGPSAISALISQIPALSPVVIQSDNAQYRFDQVIEGVTVTFPVNFVKEDGVWKIAEY